MKYVKCTPVVDDFAVVMRSIAQAYRLEMRKYDYIKAYRHRTDTTINSHKFRSSQRRVVVRM